MQKKKTNPAWVGVIAIIAIVSTIAGHFVRAIRWSTKRTYIRLFFKILDAKKRKKKYGFEWYVVLLPKVGFDTVSEHWMNKDRKKRYKIYFSTK